MLDESSASESKWPFVRNLKFWVLGFAVGQSDPQLTQDPRKVVFSKKLAQFWVKNSKEGVSDGEGHEIVHFALHWVRTASGSIKQVWICKRANQSLVAFIVGSRKTL